MIKIVIYVPDCYGTYEEGNKYCSDCQCYSYCDEATKKTTGKQETNEWKSNPKIMMG